jgi:hypothetical protein
MKSEQLNIILFAIVIYLLMQKNKKQMTNEEKLKYAEAIGTAKAFQDLVVTF